MYIIAPDSFKDAASAADIAGAIKAAISNSGDVGETVILPLSDGGEGWLAVWENYFRLERVYEEVRDALFRIRTAYYLWEERSKTAYIEMAQASGLECLAVRERNPLHTTTIGTGELILSALERGATKIVLGIGGSATNDAGIGMAVALGYQFKDKEEKVLRPVGGILGDVDYIDDRDISPLVEKCEFVVACDVENVLYGKSGAAYVYGPQKGGTPSIIAQLDRGLRHIAPLLSDLANKDVSKVKGGGAAGGLGAGAIAFLGAQLLGGAEVLFGQMNIDEHLLAATHIFTGEGRLDEQSFSGKLVGELVQKAARYKVPVTIICGYNALPSTFVLPQSVGRIISLSDNAQPTAGELKATLDKVRRLCLDL